MLISSVAFWACNKDGEEPDTPNSMPNEQEKSVLNEPEKPISACGFDNPLNDLPWLKKTIEDYEAHLERNKENMDKYWPVDRPLARIYQCIYKGGIGFLLEMCVECPDAGLELMSCQGDRLCILWGFAGDPCEEFEVDHTKNILIWERYKD